MNLEQRSSTWDAVQVQLRIIAFNDRWLIPLKHESGCYQHHWTFNERTTTCSHRVSPRPSILIERSQSFRTKRALPTKWLESVRSWSPLGSYVITATQNTRFKYPSGLVTLINFLSPRLSVLSVSCSRSFSISPFSRALERNEEEENGREGGGGGIKQRKKFR